MRNFKEYYSATTQAKVNEFTGSTDPITQKEAIEAILASDEMDKARLLISLFHYSMWRDNSILLLRAIGKTNERRGIEFLIRFIRNLEDLPLAAEAMLALGQSQSHFAGEFLLACVKDANYNLRREAVIGLAEMPHIPCDDILIQIISESDLNPALQVSAIVALGRRGSRSALPILIEKFKTKNESVFNACLLAIGHLASTENISGILDSINFQSNLLLRELAQYVEDKIHLRAQKNIEDFIVSMLINGNRGWSANFRTLKEYPAEKVWEVIDILKTHIEPNTECLIRAATFVQADAMRHFEFLIQKQAELDIEMAGNLLRLCMDTSNEALLLRFQPKYAYQLLKFVACPNLLNLVDTLFLNVEVPEKILFIDALIAQNFMSQNIQEIHCDWLYEQYKASQNKKLLQRILRGLAQLAFSKKSYLQDLRNALNEKDNSSIYYCLELISKSVSERILLERLEQCFKNADIKEIENIVIRLSRLGKLENPSSLSKLKTLNLAQVEMDLLKILVYNKVSGYEDFITSNLKNGNVALQLLGISAIATNSSKNLCDLLFPFLNGSSPQLRERALHSLCVKGTAKQHSELWAWFTDQHFFHETGVKILRCLVPHENESYRAMVLQMKPLIETPKGPFLDEQLLNELISLCDTLIVHYCKEKNTEKDPQIDLSKLDEQLGKEIKGFQKYSETVRTIIRNAEITWQHQELFDDHVDKSTMLVQYTKSADLLMQQRIGEKIFHAQDDQLLLAMQSRVMALNLEEQSPSGYFFIKHLQTESHFSGLNFPSHKLITLSKSVMNGRIMQERYRSIDGLRSWALILLLFGRNFMCKGVTYAPLLPIPSLQNIPKEKINAVAANMNNLQELRNNAAHHGVIVEFTQMTRIRDNSILLFNDLDEVFQ